MAGDGMSKTYSYVGVFDEFKLHKELLVAYPGWLQVSYGRVIDYVSINYDGNTLILILPDDAVDGVIAGIIAAHDPAAHIPISPDEIANAKRDFMLLPNWSTWTPQEGQNYIVANVWQGYTKTQANTWIDSTIVNITTANVTQINTQLGNVRTTFKAVAGAVIDLRDMMAVAVKAILFLRDVVIKYRTAVR
jgi:hypothetical protein